MPESYWRGEAELHSGAYWGAIKEASLGPDSPLNWCQEPTKDDGTSSGKWVSQEVKRKEIFAEYSPPA